jgi:ABC-type microcin C transport system duplicated ATPase subunit YejF
MSGQNRGDHGLEIRDLAKSFVIDGRVHSVFSRLDLDIGRGELVVIVGESGLRCCASSPAWKPPAGAGSR